MQRAPNWDIKLDILPVDFISKIIIKISLDRENKDKIFNLSNCQQINWLDLIHWLNDFGYDVEIVSYHEWKSSLAVIDSDNALFSLLSLYIGDEDFEEVVNKKIEIKNTLGSLLTLGMSMPLIDNYTLHKTFSYLSDRFLTKKNEYY